jgi:hypothetical protein
MEAMKYFVAQDGSAELQISPLRYAPVEMTNLTQKNMLSHHGTVASFLTNLSSRPERTRISYFAALTTTTYAALRKERRKNLINATDLDRKSGGA